MSEVPLGKPQTFRGIMMIMAAVAMFAVMDSISKYLTQFYPVTAVVWARYVFHTLLVILVLGPRLGFALVHTTRPGAQILRGLLLAGASLFFVSALQYMPLAECSAISFLAPLLVTLMAVFLLKEKVEFARWIAVAGGFIGVLTIVRPGSGVFTWASLLPLGTAACFASYQILTRRLAGLESPYTSIFYSGLVGTLLLSISLPYAWSPPQNGLHMVLFAAIGVIGGMSHLILIKAYDFALASRLAPFSYSQLIWATVAGYVAFGDFPDRWSLVGIGILMASGMYVATHQRLSERLQRAELPEAPPGA
jgi:drug/metabolite transporter (DMT)-like permease